MAWRLAKSLTKLRDQFNQMSPNRNKKSDGTIGDAKHASRKSDHNPWVKDGKTGVVTAIDITHDPKAGVDTWKIADILRLQKDPRIKYVISNHRIFSSATSPWQWRRYTGSNPHSMHMHVSVHSTKGHYDSEVPWKFSGASGPAPANPDADDPKKRAIIRRGSQGELVKEVQNILGATPYDGIFGPITEKFVMSFQRRKGLKDDGIVGPITWTEFDKIEQRRNGEHEGDAFEDPNAV
jgi:murein L,D-transpeptidase YcbB/YkuD